VFQNLVEVVTSVYKIVGDMFENTCGEFQQDSGIADG